MIDVALLVVIPILAVLMANGLIDRDLGLLLMIPAAVVLVILALMRRLTRFDSSPPWKI